MLHLQCAPNVPCVEWSHLSFTCMKESTVKSVAAVSPSVFHIHLEMQCICSYWYKMQLKQMYSLALRMAGIALCFDRNDGSWIPWLLINVEFLKPKVIFCTSTPHIFFSPSVCKSMFKILRARVRPIYRFADVIGWYWPFADKSKCIFCSLFLPIFKLLRLEKMRVRPPKSQISRTLHALQHQQ